MHEHRFKYWFHPAAALTIPTLEELDLASAPVKVVAAAFIANVDQVSRAATAPLLIVIFARAQQALIDQACLEVFGDLAHRPADDPKRAEFDEAVARHGAIWRAEADDATKFGERFFLAAGELDQLQGIDTNIRRGLEATLRGIVTGMWTAFEVMVGDLWETAVNAKPIPLAALKGQLPSRGQALGRKFSAFPSNRDDPGESSKQVRLDFLQAHAYDLSNKMGTVLKDRYNFQVLDSIRAAYLSAFDEANAEIRNLIEHPRFTALSFTRNVLVHRAALADEIFCREHARTMELQEIFPNVALGQKLHLDGIGVHNLVQPVVSLSLNLLRSVDRVISA